MAATNSPRSMNLMATPSSGYSTHIFYEWTKMAQGCSFLLSLFSKGMRATSRSWPVAWRFRHWRPAAGCALVQELAVFHALGAIVHDKADRPIFSAGPHTYARIGPIFAQDVIDHADVFHLSHIIVVIAGNSFERIHPRFFRRHSLSHVFHDGMCAGYLDVFFAIARGPGRTYILVAVTTGADDGRISAAAGNLPRQATRGGNSGHLTFLIQ